MGIQKFQIIFNPERRLRFTKVLTKYSTEYNNMFVYTKFMQTIKYG